MIIFVVLERNNCSTERETSKMRQGSVLVDHDGPQIGLKDTHKARII